MKAALLICLSLAVAIYAAAPSVRGGPGPEYCWLVFGPQGKVRVLVRLDGEAVTLEHYNGDQSTGRKERFKDLASCRGVTLHDPDGKTSYRITGMSSIGAKAGTPTELLANVTIEGPVAYQEYCDVRMSDQPKAALMAHLHGPLTAQPLTINWKVPEGFVLRLGDEPTDVRAVVGTLDAARGCWVVIRSMEGGGAHPKSAFPPGVHPFVDVEFPSRKPGGPPVKCRYPLDQFC